MWAGLTDDPFFMDLTGFGATVTNFAPSFADPPADTFAGLNTLAIVFSVDPDAVNGSLWNDDAADDTDAEASDVPWE